MKCTKCEKFKLENKVIKDMFNNIHDYMKLSFEEKMKQRACKHRWYHLIPAAGTTLKKRVPWVEIHYCLKCSDVFELKRSKK